MPPTLRARVLHVTGLLVLLGLELLMITLRFDTQGLAVATPLWAE